VLSEISQTEKERQNHMISFLCGNQKKLNSLKTERRIVVARRLEAGGSGVWEDVSAIIQNFS
jgi:hypothetical protein